MKTIAPAETDTVVVTRSLHLGQVAAACNLDFETVQAMNPQYRTGVVPGNAQPCALRLPMTAIDRFLQLGDSVYHLTPTVEVAERREEVAPAEAEVESKQAARVKVADKLWRKNAVSVAKERRQPLQRERESAKASVPLDQNPMKWISVRATRSAKSREETTQPWRSCRKSTTSTVLLSARVKNSASNNRILFVRKHHVLGG